MSGGGGLGGDREVPPVSLLGARGDLGAACAEACPEEEGGSWGKHGFPRGSEAQPSDAHAVLCGRGSSSRPQPTSFAASSSSSTPAAMTNAFGELPAIVSWVCARVPGASC